MIKEKYIIGIIIALLISIATLIAGFSLSSSAVASAAYSEDYKLDPDTISFTTEGYPPTCLYVEDSVVYGIRSSTTPSPMYSNVEFLGDVRILNDCYVVRFYSSATIELFSLVYDSEFSLLNLMTEGTQYFSMSSNFTSAVSAATFEYDSDSEYYVWQSPKISENISISDKKIYYYIATLPEVLRIIFISWVV